RATGLGTDALRAIEVDDRMRMRIDALETAIAHDREHNETPFLLVGTAGTTGAGAIDPLPELASVAQREGLWFHVDAAWGGSAALAPSLRSYLSGAEHADSLTWDAHKWLSIPLGAGMFFTRHPYLLERAFGVETGYIPPTAHGAHDLYKTSMQWSRRFSGLKLIFALAEHGVDGIGAFVEHQARMGALIRERLIAEGWRVLNDSPFPVVCFSHDTLGHSEHQTKRFTEQILARQLVWISDVRLPHHGWALRACVTSFRTDERDVGVLMDELRAVIAEG
ncbi:MAG: pyridoxal-dependent decarboxylase, partial [Gemmatimonadaceae bacterium]